MDENYISLERAIDRMYEVTEECGTERIFIDRIIDELQNLPSSPHICIHPQWIPVSERLPQEMKPVLAWYWDGHFAECARWTGRRWETTWEFEDLMGVTHWMPLPEPPKENADEVH